MHLLLHLRFQLLRTLALSLAGAAWTTPTIVAIAIASILLLTFTRILEEELFDGGLLVGKLLVMRDAKLTNSDDCDDLTAQIGQEGHEIGGQEVYLYLLSTLC